MVGDGTWLTVGEAAQVLKVGVSTVRSAVEDGKLVAGRTPGGHRRISRKSVEALFVEMYPGEDVPPAGADEKP